MQPLQVSLLATRKKEYRRIESIFIYRSTPFVDEIEKKSNLF